MPDKITELATTLTDAMNNTSKKKTKPYDTVATVTRIDEDGQAWVSIPGGVRETPVKKTFSVKPGDEVQVHVGGGRAWLQGNYSAPPTDDTRANQAYNVASESLDSATIAKMAADSAQESAEEASAAAAQAQRVTNEIEKYAETAEKSVTDILQDAEDAREAADTANTSASSALIQLSIVQDVVGVLDLLSKRGTYQRTYDQEIQPGKWYFTRTGTSPDYTYQVVSNPTGDPRAQGFYELTGIDQAVQNYVSSHLALDDNGLWLQADSSNAKLYLSSEDGVVLYGPGGIPVAKYGTDTYIGDYTSANGYYIKLDSVNNEIGFYQGSNKVAYMNGSQLYVANSLSFGHFVFYERSNGHFTLKRIS